MSCRKDFNLELEKRQQRISCFFAVFCDLALFFIYLFKFFFFFFSSLVQKREMGRNQHWSGNYEANFSIAAAKDNSIYS